jgi:hypothetical protein
VSNSSEHRPFSQPEPLPAQYPQQLWQPSAPVPKQNNGLAITALVVASLALLTGLGVIVSQVVSMLFLGFFASGMGGLPDGPSLEGTAPQVVAGQAYPGSLLEDEVVRTINGFGADVRSVSCPVTPAVVADAETVCRGPIDGSDATVKVTFEDSLGHFTVSWS